MFSRNRSAQLLEQPLLSRFAPDLRRRTRAFAYKPHHKIHNTSPRRAITTEDRHRSREFMQNRGGDSLADRRFSKQNPSSSHRLVPFSSLASGEHREAFASVSQTCTANGPLPGAPIARSLGHSKKACEITHQQAKEKLPFAFIDDLAPNAGGHSSILFSILPLAPSIEREDRAGNDECPHKSSTKRKEERGEEEGLSGRSTPFVRRNGEKPGTFAK